MRRVLEKEERFIVVTESLKLCAKSVQPVLEKEERFIVATESLRV